MTRLPVVALVVVLVSGVFIASRSGCFDGKPTKVETRVDSTLGSVPAWEDTVKQQRATIASERAARQKDRLARIEESRRANKEKARADSLQQWADDLAEVPTNLPAGEQNQRLRVALAAQRRAAGALSALADSLMALRAKDSVRLHDADSTLADREAWLAQRDQRIDRLTKDLGDLRTEGKKRGKFLGFLPPWADEAILASGAFALGVAVASR